MTNATVRASALSAPTEAPALRRELGKWDLTAIGINQVIGSGVFIVPSLVAAQLGTWSPLALLAAGFASLLVALCFAELRSRFEGTAGLLAGGGNRPSPSLDHYVRNAGPRLDQPQRHKTERGRHPNALPITKVYVMFSNFVALPPSIATRSASLIPGALRM